MNDALGLPLDFTKAYGYIHQKYNRLCWLIKETKAGVTINVLKEARLRYNGNGPELTEYYEVDERTNIMSCKLFPIDEFLLEDDGAEVDILKRRKAQLEQRIESDRAECRDIWESLKALGEI